MKKYIFSVLAVGAMLFTSCSSDDNYNTAGGVTVDMKLADYSVRESGGIFKLPIQVTGETNGEVIVYVKTTPATESPAVADENYSLTSSRIIIPAGETVGYVELQPIDNVEENDPRYFDVTIDKAEGASIGSQPTTLVQIKDNDQDPYEKMSGKWIMECTSVFNGGNDGPFELSVTTPDPEDEDEAPYYGHELYGYGLNGYSFIYLTFNFEYEESTDVITMSIQTGTFCTTGIINFGFNGIVKGASVYAPGTLNFGDDIELTVERDEKGKVISLTPTDPEAMFLLMVQVYPAMSANAGYWDGWYDMKFTR